MTDDIAVSNDEPDMARTIWSDIPMPPTISARLAQLRSDILLLGHLRYDALIARYRVGLISDIPDSDIQIILLENAVLLDKLGI